MYCGHPRMCVCVSVCLCLLSAAACLRYCTDPDVACGSGRECPLLVHHLADLQSVHGLRCYGNITRTLNVSEYMIVLAICLVVDCGQDARFTSDIIHWLQRYEFEIAAFRYHGLLPEICLFGMPF